METLKLWPYHPTKCLVLYYMSQGLKALIFFFFFSGMLESNFESLIHKMSIFTLNAKWRDNTKPKCNESTAIKLSGTITIEEVGIFSEECHFSFTPQIDLNGHLPFQMELK